MRSIPPPADNLPGADVNIIGELQVIPIDPDNEKKVGHDYETAGFVGPDRGECIIEGCKAKPKTICWSCSKDTISMF